MSKNFDDLDKTFDVTPEQAESLEIIKKKPSKKPLVISDKEEDREKDYQYARAQLYDIVEKMQESLNTAMDVAQESEHPRAFEVVFNGANTNFLGANTNVSGRLRITGTTEIVGLNTTSNSISGAINEVKTTADSSGDDSLAFAIALG